MGRDVAAIRSPARGISSHQPSSCPAIPTARIVPASRSAARAIECACSAVSGSAAAASSTEHRQSPPAPRHRVRLRRGARASAPAFAPTRSSAALQRAHDFAPSTEEPSPSAATSRGARSRPCPRLLVPPARRKPFAAGPPATSGRVQMSAASACARARVFSSSALKQRREHVGAAGGARASAARRARDRVSGANARSAPRTRVFCRFRLRLSRLSVPRSRSSRAAPRPCRAARVKIVKGARFGPRNSAAHGRAARLFPREAPRVPAVHEVRHLFVVAERDREHAESTRGDGVGRVPVDVLRDGQERRERAERVQIVRVVDGRDELLHLLKRERAVGFRAPRVREHLHRLLDELLLRGVGREQLERRLDVLALRAAPPASARGDGVVAARFAGAGASVADASSPVAAPARLAPPSRAASRGRSSRSPS